LGEKECYRVLKHSGLLIAGMDNGINYLFADDTEKEVVNSLPFNPLKNQDELRICMRIQMGMDGCIK
jgi:hypothetical protein